MTNKPIDVSITLGNGKEMMGKAEQVTDDYTLFEVQSQNLVIPDDIEKVSYRISIYGTEFVLLKIPAARVKVLARAEVNAITDEMFEFLEPNERPYGLF